MSVVFMFLLGSMWLLGVYLFDVTFCVVHYKPLFVSGSHHIIFLFSSSSLVQICADIPICERT